MKKNQIKLNFFFIIIFMFLFSCATGLRSDFDELENKGSALGLSAPLWLTIYQQRGIYALQDMPEFRDKYLFIGEQSGTNRQLIISWADTARAQQQIAAALRTNITSRYRTAISADNAVRHQQEIEIVLNAVVSVSFSGAQREADWWSLRRHFDSGNREVFTDRYTAWVLYSVPRQEFNSQIARAMETSVLRHFALFDVTIALARDILLQGYDTRELQSTDTILQTASHNYDPPDSIVAQALDDVSLLEEYVLGRDVAAAILYNYRLYDANPALVNYLNMICHALVVNSPRPAAFNGYRVAVLDSDLINAFATPGGHIFVTRGLIAAANSEDALAAVIAHELAHIQLRHGMRAIRTNRDIDDWMRQLFFSGGRIVADILNAGLSQTQEFDADIAAMSLLVAAGYNPHGLIDMLVQLERTQSITIGGFNSTHPSPISRLINARIAIKRYANISDNSRIRQRRFDAITR